MELSGPLGDTGRMGERARTGERCLADKGDTGRLDGDREDRQGDGERLSLGERQRRGDVSRPGDLGSAGDKCRPGEKLHNGEEGAPTTVVSKNLGVFGETALLGLLGLAGLKLASWTLGKGAGLA